MPILLYDSSLWLGPYLDELVKYMDATPKAPESKTEDFRPLPTPEQVRAHGDGGLWEGTWGTLYKFFDRPRDEPWWDSPAGGRGFCSHGGPWHDSIQPVPGCYRPLRRIGEVRPWAEIDAIIAGAAATASTPAEPETPTTPTIVPPPGGKFQVGDVVTLHRFSSNEWFAGGNPRWNESMARYVGLTATIDRVPDYAPGRVCASGWTWPVERVSFVSRPGVTAATPTAAEPEFRVPTDGEIRAHEANGGMWQRKGLDNFRLLVKRFEEARELIQAAKHAPIQTVKAVEPLTVLSVSPSALITRADSLGAEAQRQIAQTIRDEMSARGFTPAPNSVSAALIDVFALEQAKLREQIAQQAVADVFTRMAQEAKPPTKENTNMAAIPIPGITTTTIVTPKPASLPATLKQELKEDGIEILYRGTARTLNREAKDLVVKYLVSQLPAKKRKSAMSMFAAAFDTEAGTALCGALLSLLPHMAAYLGKPVGPKLTRLARECRREGGTDAVARIMSELMGMLKLLTELGDKYLSSLPDEEAREVEAPSSVSAGSLPSASPVVDFSAPPEMAKVGA